MKKSIVCLPLLKTIRNLEKLNQGSSFNYEIGQRSQDLLYFENGLLYITKAALILENRIISEKAFPYLVNHIFAQVDIDTQEDFDYAAFFN
jgi:N-acylneuraminate cytidylyltransferase